MLKPFVYLVGASGVGKTTLAGAIAKLHGLPVVESIGCRLAAEFGGFDKINADLEVQRAYQETRWVRTVERLEAEVRGRRAFVCDRSLDTLAYSAWNSTATLAHVRGEHFDRMMALLRDKPLGSDQLTVVFFVRPCPAVLDAAFEDRAGTDLERFSTTDCVHRVDGVIQYLLEANGVPYVPISCPDLRDRVRTVDRVIQLATQR